MSFLNNFLVFRQTVYFRSKQTRRTHGEYRSSRLESIKIDKQFRTRPSHLVTIVFRVSCTGIPWFRTIYAFGVSVSTLSLFV